MEASLSKKPRENLIAKFFCSLFSAIGQPPDLTACKPRLQLQPLNDKRIQKTRREPLYKVIMPEGQRLRKFWPKARSRLKHKPY
jgi:hypothetical protein